jgi:hypothetical protein
MCPNANPNQGADCHRWLFGGQRRTARLVGPLSPLLPAVPFPATVAITPFETLRTQLLALSAT